MSYDLNLYKKKKQKISQEHIENYLDKLPHVTRENETHWFYHNKETGCYCNFSYNTPEEDDRIEAFEPFEDTHFFFHINYLRPQFFGKECFPILDQLLEELDLYVFNPQGDGEPKKYEKGALEAEWGKSNLSFSKSNFNECELSYLDMEKSDASWQFCYNRSHYESKLGFEYFVPDIFYVQKTGTKVVETFCVWPDHIPVVLPKVDYVVVRKKVKKFFITRQAEGLVKYSDVIERLSDFFVEEEACQILHPNDAPKIAKLFNDLPLMDRLETYGEGVSVEQIVNVKGD